jgi:hypothetical protein
MVRAFFVLISANLLFSACTQRMICPAYQSAFIYDQDELRKKFSYFEGDSIPKVYTASKNKYLVAEDLSYRRRLRGIQTVPMKPVNVAVPDSLQPGYVPGMDDLGADGEDGVVPGAELDLAARSVEDSTYIVDVPRDTVAAEEEDSVYMISKDKELRLLKYDFPDSLVYDSISGKYVRETPKYYVKDIKFNVEQDNYMWYLRDYLVLPDVRLAHLNQAEGGNGKSAKGKKEKKGFFGFFKNLFKKKKKTEPADSTIQQAPVKSEDDFDYVDEDEQQQQQATQTDQPTQPENKKGGPFGFLKKKNKKAAAEPAAGSAPAEVKPDRKSRRDKKKEETPPPTEEEKKKEEEDGF